MRAVVVAAAIAVTLTAWSSGPTTEVSAAARPCQGWASRRTPPPTIRVYLPRGHRVIELDFRRYVGHVLAAGASPASPRRDLDAHAVMAFAVSGYAWWEANHPSEEKRAPDGTCWDVRNGGWDHAQYVRPYSGWRWPNRLQRAAIDAVWGARARTSSRFIRTGWTAGSGGRCGSGGDGWHLPEDETTACAKRGWSWQRIVRHYLGCCRIVEPRQRGTGSSR